MSRRESSVTIDAEGKVELPKEVRDELGLSAGEEVELKTEGETIFIRAKKQDTEADTEELIEMIDRVTAEAVANRTQRPPPSTQTVERDVHASSHRRAIERRAEQSEE
jgi:AbrB family looped-hinge helix DNA binding protein